MTESRSDHECKYRKNSRQKTLCVNELQKLSNEELIERIIKLDAYNCQLKNLLQKKPEEEKKVDDKVKKCKFENSGRRHVLLKLYYLGWDCQGFVVQDDTVNTIEHHLFKALEKCCLIERRETSNYQRCGRTDKGVSAFCQVISIDLRSKFKEPTADNCKDELPYLCMLNHLLPDHIRCYAWAHVENNVGARFSCSSRAYKYYFPKGDLNISLMKEGLKYLIGTHDFRNFCKMDVGNGVTEYVRNISHAEIKPFSSSTNEGDYEMFKFIIRGNGFLWHQVRCIMAVVFLIGQERETPDIIRQLLDVRENPSKPQYRMANHTPLTLFEAEYDSLDLRWNVEDKELNLIIQLLQKQWTFHCVKQTMVKEMINELSELKQEAFEIRYQVDPLICGRESKVYKPLLSRMRCESLENRIDHYVKKRKLLVDVKNEECCAETSN